MRSVLFPVNLYGPGDHFDVETGHVIPGMIRKFLEARDDGGDEVILWEMAAQPANSFTSETLPGPSASRWNVTTVLSQSTSAQGRKSPSGTWRKLSRLLHGVLRHYQVGHIKAKRPAIAAS